MQPALRIKTRRLFFSFWVVRAETRPKQNGKNTQVIFHAAYFGWRCAFGIFADGGQLNAPVAELGRSTRKISQQFISHEDRAERGNLRVKQHSSAIGAKALRGIRPFKAWGETQQWGMNKAACEIAHFRRISCDAFRDDA